MQKQKSQRQGEVTSKLSYVGSLFQNLMSELFKAKRESRDPANLVHSASDVLSNTRECFDYLAKDIIDSHIVPFTDNLKIKNAYASGRLRAYFPFHEKQIKSPKELFHELQRTSPSLYSDLVNFTESITNKKRMPNTLFGYELLMELKDMVNEKKHDKLVALISETYQEHLIEDESFKMVVPQKGQVGWKSFAVLPGTRVACVTEYRFAYNDREVGKFCLFAYKATEIVIQKLYADYFK